jgi:hypothetical protein
LTEEQSSLSTSPGIERARGEIGKLLAGEEYAPEVFDCSDLEIRKFVGASLLASFNNGLTEAASRAQAAYLEHGYFDDTTRELRSSNSLPQRLAAIERLVLFGGSLATLHLIASLYDTNPEVRRAAVEGLGSLRDPEALLGLNELLAREDSELLPASTIQAAIDAINRSDANASKTVALLDPESEPPLLEIEASESPVDIIDLSALIESEIYPDDEDVSVNFLVEEQRLLSEEETLAKAVATVERRRQEMESARVQAESQLREQEEPKAKAANDAREQWLAVEGRREGLDAEATRRRNEEEARLRSERQARSLVQEEARRLAEEEEQIRNEAESLRQAQQEVALRRAEIALVRAEEERHHNEDGARQKLDEAQARNAAFEEQLAELKQNNLAQAAREEELRLELEAVNRAGEAQRSRIEEAETRLRAEHEEQIRIEMEALRQASAEQRQRTESAAAMRAAEEAAHQRAVAEARQQDQEERSRIEKVRLEAEARKQRLAELDSLRLRVEQENQAGAKEEERLKSALLSLQEAKAEQQQRIAEAEALRMSEEAELLKAAEDARSRDEHERQRIADAARVETEAWQQRQTELQDLHAQAQNDAELQAAEEANLRASLEALQKDNDEQRERLREAEKERAAAEAEQVKAAAESRQRDEEHQRQQSEAIQHAAEAHQLRMTGLAALQAQAERELEEQANEETGWRSTIDSLHMAVEEQRQRVAAIEADVATAEAKKLALAQEETRLKSDLYTLRQTIAEQQLTNDELKSQREREETHLREAADVARAMDQETAQRLAAAIQEQDDAALQRQQELEALNDQLNKEAALQSAEHERLMNELSANREQAAEQSRLYIAQEEQLRADIDSLCQGNADRWRLIEELKSVQGVEESNRQDTETRILELASVQRRRIKDARSRTEDEERRLGELHHQRDELETQAEALEREVRQVQQAIEEAAKQVEEQQERRAELDALRAQYQEQTRKNAEEEAGLLAELESMRLQVAEQANEHHAREQEMLGAIESQRGLEAELKQRMAELESAVAALKAEAEAREELEHEVLAQLETQGRLEAEQDAPLAEQFLGSEDDEALQSAAELERLQAAEAVPVHEVDSLKEAQAPELLLAEVDTPERLSLHNDREEQLLVEIEQLRLTVDEQKRLMEEAESIHRIELEAVKAAQSSSTENKLRVNSLELEPSADTKEIKLFGLRAPQSVSPAPWVDVNLFESATAAHRLQPLTATAESNRELSTEEKSLVLADEELTLEITLRRQLASKDPTERSAALVDLARLGGDDVFALIVRSFDDPSPQVRNTAARALYDLCPDRAASFTRALREGSLERKRRIGAALAGSGLATSAISGLAGESRERTYTAFSLLFLMSKAGELKPLIEAVEEHPNLETRLTAVTLLAMSGQPEVDPAFRRLAVRGSLPSRLRSAVMAAMHQINEARHGLRTLG